MKKCLASRYIKKTDLQPEENERISQDLFAFNSMKRTSFLWQRQAFSDWFRDAATCAPIEDKTLSKRIARSEENEVTIAIPLLEATCHSLNGWWSLTACSIFNWYDWLQCMANSNCKTRICNRYRLLY